MRYAAYRQFCWFVHARLDREVRRVTPSCVVNKIRAEYPSDDGQYVGFKDGLESPEIDFLWIGEMHIFVYTNFTCLFKKNFLDKIYEKKKRKMKERKKKQTSKKKYY